MKAIILDGICKSFGTPPVPVLENFSATLEAGFTCLMGQSGIGKTTLANILAGQIAPDRGKIIGNADKKVAYVFQDDRLLLWETALSNVLFVTPQAKKNTPRAIELLTQAGLAESLHKKAAELSGGMKRRVALCRALISTYDLLILDEPFKGLDETTKPAIIDLLRQNVPPEKIVLCITHDPAEATALGGNLLRICNGKPDQ